VLAGDVRGLHWKFCTFVLDHEAGLKRSGDVPGTIDNMTGSRDDGSSLLDATGCTFLYSLRVSPSSSSISQDILPVHPSKTPNTKVFVGFRWWLFSHRTDAFVDPTLTTNDYCSTETTCIKYGTTLPGVSAMADAVRGGDH